MPGPRTGTGQSPRATTSPTIPSQPTFITMPNGSRFWAGKGVPAATLGLSGDLYTRNDGGGAGATHLYYKNGAAWLGIA